MADIVIMKVCKPTTSPNSTLFCRSFGSKVQRASSAPKIVIKNYTFSSSIFNTKKDLKGHTLLSTWNFFLSVMETRIVFLNLARSCWVIQSCWASQSYQRNISYTPPSLQGLQGVTWAYKGYRGYWDYNVRLQSYKIK